MARKAYTYLYPSEDLRSWAQPVFESVFREYGLPEKIRTDNGTPFASVYFSDISLGFLDDEQPELGLISPPVTCWARVK